MAKATSKTTSSLLYQEKSKKSNKGIHSKNNSSKSKKSQNYIKVNVGQGR